MATLTLENLPNDLFAKLESHARRHGKSLADEAAEILERGLSHVDNEPLAEEALLESIRADREALVAKGVFLSDEDMDAAIKWGRK